jgi:ATP-GRASP peptide maturase of grasp-with-spasm system
MYCIIFSEDNDWSTNDVIDWIKHLKLEYKRIDFNRILSSSFNFNFSDYENFKIVIDDEIKLEDIKSLWYRRTTPININRFKADLQDEDELLNMIISHQVDELRYTRNAFFNNTSRKKWLNNPATSIIDKTYCLVQAKNCGLTIPETIITNNKKDVILFKKIQENVIVKPIYNISVLQNEDTKYLQYTFELTEDHINKLEDDFFPCLIQKKIIKQIELRVFFLNGKIYPMALFSQDNEQTKEDFRRYDYENPTRKVPYKLSDALESKIRLFMNNVNLNSGSLDFILDTNGSYYFLEVNPVGQFGMTSFPCNYYIEKDIANFLTSD